MNRIKMVLCSIALATGSSNLITQAQVQFPTTAVFDNEYQSAGGCQDTGREVSIAIPNAGQLDLSIVDPVWHIPGVTFRETTHVGNSGIRNVAISGNILRYQIFAGGGGSYEGWPINGCVGASGGSYGVEVTAHYRKLPTKPATQIRKSQ